MKRNYYREVYDIVTLIPEGKISTYGAIADYLSLGSARMVGWALTQSNMSAENYVPAHRVVNAKGELSGRHHFPTPSFMEEILKQEGVMVENDKIINFKDHFWHPQELG